MSERRLWSLLLVVALALCVWGCNGRIKVPPLDCRTFGCQAGQECKPVGDAERNESIGYACKAQPGTELPQIPEPTCTPNPCPSDRPLCMVITVDGTPTGRKVIACAAPVVQPTPEPKPACDLREADLEPAPVQREATLTSAVIAAQRKLGPRPGSDPHVSLALLAAELRAAGLCSIAGQEAIFSRAQDGLVEEHHAVYFGNGDWIASGKYMGVHREARTQTTPEGGQAEAGKPPAPEQPSAPRGACPDPLPLRVYEDGAAHWFLKCSPWGGPNAGITDCSVKVKGQPEFCLAVWGRADLNCDLGPEDTAERACREKYLYGATVTVEARNGAECWRYGDNPMQVQGTRRGDCRLCSVSSPTVCSDWF